MRSTPPFFPLYPMSYISYFGSNGRLGPLRMHLHARLLYVSVP